VVIVVAPKMYDVTVDLGVIAGYQTGGAYSNNTDPTADNKYRVENLLAKAEAEATDTHPIMVYFPAGTYTIKIADGGWWNVRSNLIIKGAGEGKTIIQWTGGFTGAARYPTTIDNYTDKQAQSVWRGAFFYGDYTVNAAQMKRNMTIMDITFDQGNTSQTTNWTDNQSRGVPANGDALSWAHTNNSGCLRVTVQNGNNASAGSAPDDAQAVAQGNPAGSVVQWFENHFMVNCTVNDCKADGFTYFGKFRGMVIRNCTITRTGDDSIALQDGNNPGAQSFYNCLIENCHIQDNLTWVQDSTNFAADNVTITGRSFTAGSAINVNGGRPTGSGGTSTILRGNVVAGGFRSGIRVESQNNNRQVTPYLNRPSGVQLINNTVTYTGLNRSTGAGLTPNADHNDYSYPGSGFLIRGADIITMSGNTSQHNRLEGLHIEGVTQLTDTGGNYSDNGHEGVWISSEQDTASGSSNTNNVVIKSATINGNGRQWVSAASEFTFPENSARPNGLFFFGSRDARVNDTIQIGGAAAGEGCTIGNATTGTQTVGMAFDTPANYTNVVLTNNIFNNATNSDGLRPASGTWSGNTGVPNWP